MNKFLSIYLQTKRLNEVETKNEQLLETITEQAKKTSSVESLNQELKKQIEEQSQIIAKQAATIKELNETEVTVRVSYMYTPLKEKSTACIKCSIFYLVIIKAKN